MPGLMDMLRNPGWQGAAFPALGYAAGTPGANPIMEMALAGRQGFDIHQAAEKKRLEEEAEEQHRLEEEEAKRKLAMQKLMLQIGGMDEAGQALAGQVFPGMDMSFLAESNELRAANAQEKKDQDAAAIAALLGVDLPGGGQGIAEVLGEAGQFEKLSRLYGSAGRSQVTAALRPPPTPKTRGDFTEGGFRYTYDAEENPRRVTTETYGESAFEELRDSILKTMLSEQKTRLGSILHADEPVKTYATLREEAGAAARSILGSPAPGASRAPADGGSRGRGDGDAGLRGLSPVAALWGLSIVAVSVKEELKSRTPEDVRTELSTKGYSPEEIEEIFSSLGV